MCLRYKYKTTNATTNANTIAIKAMAATTYKLYTGMHCESLVREAAREGNIPCESVV